MRAMLTDCSESFVARRVQKRDGTIIMFDLVRRNVLCDSACLCSCDLFAPDSIKQTGFTMVHVPHYGNYRRTACRSVAYGSFLTRCNLLVMRLLNQCYIEIKLINDNLSG